MRKFLFTALLCCLAACGPEATPEQGNATVKVATSGKRDVALSAIPPDVLAAAMAAQLGFTATEAQSETRDGRSYYDIGGTLPDGSEIEFDIMEEGGIWRVVETQRDIAFEAVPEKVRRAALAKDPAFVPSRVIESRQADGLVIYELYSAADGDPQGRKLEVKWDGKSAETLTGEWAH